MVFMCHIGQSQLQSAAGRSAMREPVFNEYEMHEFDHGD